MTKFYVYVKVKGKPIKDIVFQGTSQERANRAYELAVREYGKAMVEIEEVRK